MKQMNLIVSNFFMRRIVGTKKYLAFHNPRPTFHNYGHLPEPLDYSVQKEDLMNCKWLLILGGQAVEGAFRNWVED